MITKKLVFFIILFLLFSFLLPEQILGQKRLQPQKYLVLDKYSPARVYLAVGDPIRFRLKKDNLIFNDYIAELNLQDSSIMLVDARMKIYLREFDTFYFDRRWTNLVRGGLNFIGGGFLFSAAVHPLVGNALYDPKEQAIIGLSAVALGQTTKFFRIRKFKIDKNSRIQILDLSKTFGE